MTEHFLKDFTRRQWVSTEAKSLWEPRLALIGAQFDAAERESVERGKGTLARRAALQFVSPQGLAQLVKVAGRLGLVALPLEVESLSSSSYSASGGGGALALRAVVTRPADAAGFVSAWTARDDDAIGDLLGFPKCCRDYFADTWGKGSVDPTWGMKLDRPDHCDGPLEANILLRWLGVRYVPHMPCSFNCEASVELGRSMRALVAPIERAWLDELLDMPMRWSAVNGIGLVETPIVTINFRTDPAPELREIRRKGRSYPDASAYGVRFPYKPPPARQAEQLVEAEVKKSLPGGEAEVKPPKNGHSQAASAEQSESPANELAEQTEGQVKTTLNEIVGLLEGELDAEGKAYLWIDNGFGSLELMNRAHGAILAVRPPDKPRTVLDLGCGNGRLARAMAAGGTAIGVEVEPDRARRADGRLDDVVNFDMFAVDLGRWDPALTLMMPGRLVESDAGDALAAQLEKLGGELLVYAYGDWLERYGTLEALCRAAGLKGDLMNPRADKGVEAGLWRFTQ